MNKNFLSKIEFNSPAILTFTSICLLALALDLITFGNSTDLVFSTYNAPLNNPLTYVRLIGHVFGHADLDHLVGNLMLILLVGPLLEEKYGTYNMWIIILITALITGICNNLIFPNIQLLGASGVVFAFILLSSFTNTRSGKTPITFIMIAILYLSTEIYAGLFIPSNVSNFTHILGGFIGAFLGYVLNKRQAS